MNSTSDQRQGVSMKIQHDARTGQPLVQLDGHYVKAGHIFSNDRSCWYSLESHRGNFIPDPELKAHARAAHAALEAARD